MSSKVRIKYTEEYPELPDKFECVENIVVSNDNTLFIYGTDFKLFVHPDHWVSVMETED